MQNGICIVSISRLVMVKLIRNGIIGDKNFLFFFQMKNMVDMLVGMLRMRKIMFIIIWMENEELLLFDDCRVGFVFDEIVLNGVEFMIIVFVNVLFVLVLL